MFENSDLSRIVIYRPAIVVTAALAGGIASGACLPGYLLPAGCGLLLFFALTVRDILYGRSGAIWSVLFMALAGYFSIQPWVTAVVSENHVSRYAGERYWKISGVVAGQPRVSGKRWRFILAAEELNAGNRRIVTSGRVMVSGRDTWPGPVRGDRVVFIGRLGTIRSFANPGGFDYERFMDFQAVKVRAYAKTGTLRRTSGGIDCGWPGELDKFRSRLSRKMESALDGFARPTVQLLQAILLGDRDSVPPSVRQAFNRSGVGHVLAISGLHIGMVAAASFAIVRWLLAWIPVMLRHAWTRKGAALISLVPVTGYALLAGMSPSTQRAAVMASVFLLGFWVGRRHDWFNTLALAGLMILIAYPPALFSISFQLSFLAVIAILCGLTNLSARPVDPDLALNKRLIRRMLSFVSISTLAFLGTLPVVLHYFNQISIAGLAVNLVVVPLVGTVVVPVGLAGVAVAALNADLGSWLWQFAALGMELVRMIVFWTAQQPWSAVRWVTPTGFEICLYYLGGALLLNWKRITRPKTLLAVLFLVSVLDAGYWVYQRFGRQDLRLTVIDVGQGTANLLELPNGFTILVDGGGFSDNSAFDVGEKIVAPLLWRRKIATVDLVVLSHANSDHLNGLLYILGHFKVKEIWSNGESSPGAGFRQWRRLIVSGRIPHRDVAELPEETKCHGVLLKVLAPPRDFKNQSAAAPWRDLNNNSFVLQTVYKDVSILFSGDIMASAEAELVSRMGGKNLKSTILVVPHHGSRSSSTPVFLHAVQPKEALISAGWRNHFGFPHADVLQRLKAMGVSVWCTADNGALQVVTDGNSYQIETSR